MGPDGPEHLHPGYKGWHPVNQKHKNPNLHQSLGITGKEKPNRRSPSELGIEDLSQKPKPKKKPKQFGSEYKPQWKWDDSISVPDYLKQYARAKPRTKTGRVLCDAVNSTGWLLRRFTDIADKVASKYASQGYEDAFRAFDERFKFHGDDDFNRLSAQDIRRIDGDLERMAREKYAEYGGAKLKGKIDPESLRRKAEIRTYIEIQRKLRERARAENDRKRMYQYSNTSGDGQKPKSAREIRERNKRRREQENTTD